MACSSIKIKKKDFDKVKHLYELQCISAAGTYPTRDRKHIEIYGNQEPILFATEVLQKRRIPYEAYLGNNQRFPLIRKYDGRNIIEKEVV